MPDVTHLACRCGSVRMALSEEPILTAECMCNSCRAAAGRMAALPGASPATSSIGGSPYVLYRKDRVRFTAGADQLGEFRLTPESHTRRVVATCCNTPLFTEFQHGHWLSIYASLWPEATRPAMQMRTMASDLPDASVLPTDVPNAKTQPLSFMAKLLGAWVAMGFRTGKIDVPKQVAA
ncbi:MAG: GFA family protein [Devosia sp.]